MPPRYLPNPNRVTLDLDPATSEALTGAAKANKMTRHRLAYELVQRGLGVSVISSLVPSVVEPEADPFAQAMQRGLDDISRFTFKRD